MTFGEEGKEGARVHNLNDVEAILDEFMAHGHTEVRSFSSPSNVYRQNIIGKIDTARTYSGGTSEEYLGKIDWKSRGLKIETKLYPNAAGSLLSFSRAVLNYDLYFQSSKRWTQNKAAVNLISHSPEVSFNSQGHLTNLH
jgi:aflatoxin B1 aldehyde reductase